MTWRGKRGWSREGVQTWPFMDASCFVSDAARAVKAAAHLDDDGKSVAKQTTGLLYSPARLLLCRIVPHDIT